MTPAFRLLLNRFAMPGLERELAMLDMLGDDDWTMSPSQATASVRGRTLPLQFLGTRSEATNTWLWAWASKGAPVPAQALDAAKKCRQTGKKRSIGELEADTLDLDQFDFDAHTLSLAAIGVAGLPAYYRFPYKGGALYAGFAAGSLDLPSANAGRVVQVIRDAVSRINLDARIAVNAYLTEKGAKLSGERDHLVAVLPNGGGLNVDFDAAGQLQRVEEIPEPRTAHV